MIEPEKKEKSAVSNSMMMEKTRKPRYSVNDLPSLPSPFDSRVPR